MVSFEVIQLNVPEGTLKNCGNLTITTLRAVFETGMSLTQVHIVHTGAHVYDINPWSFSVCLSVCLSVCSYSLKKYLQNSQDTSLVSLRYTKYYLKRSCLFFEHDVSPEEK